MSGSLSPVELVLLTQLLRHLFPAYPLACFCLSSGLVAMDAICRHCLATSAQPVRFTYRGLIVATLNTCSFGYYALSARLFRPATVARQLLDLANLAAFDWQLVSAWLALFGASLLLAGLSGRLPLRQMTQRKLFHFLAAAAFAVALLLGGDQRLELLSAAAFGLLAILLALDTLRRHDVAGVGRRLRSLLAPLIGPRDSAQLLLTPLALLLGLAAPIWLRLAGGRGAGIPAWAGILSVGVGDSLAGLVGSRFGRVRWPQMSRTLEGSAACFFGQLASLRCLLSASGLDSAGWPAYLLPVFSVTLVEAFLAQVDNLALPLCLYFLLAQ
ncbi:hypothetical protein BOX15_Mlig000163g2 [Macrostomum lignano]|uniref:dolichol kinase n=1 Tax=Macrostomum lignano TaxID=282301 RepID=A0A267G055_9PLAT|nr:hypothetical protein BOX15_Mlig000163g2 [Macrostomum lignano]